jgi:hypothetical protein
MEFGEGQTSPEQHDQLALRGLARLSIGDYEALLASIASFGVETHPMDVTADLGDVEAALARETLPVNRLYASHEALVEHADTLLGPI